MGDPQLLMQIHDELIYEIGKGPGVSSLFQSRIAPSDRSGSYDRNNIDRDRDRDQGDGLLTYGGNNCGSFVDTDGSNNYTRDSNTNMGHNRDHNRDDPNRDDPNMDPSQARLMDQLSGFQQLLQRCMGTEVRL